MAGGDREGATLTARAESDLDYEVIVVAYRSGPLVVTLLERLGPDVDVAVVDNARDADGLRAVAEARPRTRYLPGPGGYSAAINAGVSGSTAAVGVFVNPDIAPDREQIEELVRSVAADPALVACCGLDLAPDGRPVLGVGGWEPSVRRTVAHVVGAHKVLPRSGLWARPELHEDIDVDWTGGACNAVRLDRFRELGGFAETYFLYSEDVEFGRAARGAGLRSQIRTDVPIRSSGSRTSGDSSTRMLQVRGDSMMRYVRSHGSRSRAETIRAVLTAGMALRLLLTRVRGRKAEAAEHGAYLRGLWRGRPEMADSRPAPDGLTRNADG